MAALVEQDDRLARALVKRLIDQDGLDLATAKLSYDAWKYQPTKSEFHQAAGSRLRLMAEGDVAISEILSVYHDYAAVTQGRLGLENSQLLSLAEHFAAPESINEAADLVRRVLHEDDENPQLPHAMLNIAKVFADIDAPHSRRLLYDIIGLFPESPEARIAKKTLGK
ncbi:MAG: hypothetical protein DHS20C11_36790 [Lysobacteraceae bacterium]|nr:MAG: hypothetical protein DHS20C11_36790 [Xanthomonadaceae bacterium]